MSVTGNNNGKKAGSMGDLNEVNCPKYRNGICPYISQTLKFIEVGQLMPMSTPLVVPERAAQAPMKEVVSCFYAPCVGNRCQMWSSSSKGCGLKVEP